MKREPGDDRNSKIFTLTSPANVEWGGECPSPASRPGSTSNARRTTTTPPHERHPVNQTAPTPKELDIAIRLGAAFAKVGYAITESTKQTEGIAEQASRTMTVLITSITFLMPRRQRRRFQTWNARQTRRPALLHNGRKP